LIFLFKFFLKHGRHHLFLSGQGGQQRATPAVPGSPIARDNSCPQSPVSFTQHHLLRPAVLSPWHIKSY